MDPPTSLKTSKIVAIEVLEVGEDGATTLVLGQELKVLHSEEGQGQSSQQLEIKVTHLVEDEVQTKVAAGIEATNHVKNALVL